MSFKNILALAPHTDDIELGCGGLLRKYNNSNIFILAFSEAPETRPGNIQQEFKESCEFMGAQYQFLGLQPRTLRDNQQKILDHLWQLNKEQDFDLVLCPSSYDNHQDHEVVRDEACRIFKHTTILGYETPWNNRRFHTDLFVRLTQQQINDKMFMINLYKSQFGREMFKDKECALNLAKIRGLQIKCQYAEAYEVIRCVL